MRIFNVFIVSVILIFLSTDSFAQEDSRPNEYGVLLANVVLGGHVPGGDLADRFQRNLFVGLGSEYITRKNLIFGLEGYMLFGNFVKEDILASLRNPDGFIVGNTRSYADIQLRERGLNIGGYVGKLFAVGKQRNRSGIRTTLGLTLFQHKVRIQDDPESFVPALDKEYKKGYDQLSNGLALNEFIGYQFLAQNRRINFFAGIEMVQAFTKNRRSINFGSRESENESRLDLLFGLKFGWSLPFYIGQKPDEIYY